MSTNELLTVISGVLMLLGCAVAGLGIVVGLAKNEYYTPRGSIKWGMALGMVGLLGVMLFGLSSPQREWTLLDSVVGAAVGLLVACYVIKPWIARKNSDG